MMNKKKNETTEHTESTEINFSLRPLCLCYARLAHLCADEIHPPLRHNLKNETTERTESTEINFSLRPLRLFCAKHLCADEIRPPLRHNLKNETTERTEIKRIFFCAILLLLAACYRVPDEIDPKVSYPLQNQHFSRLASAFDPLSSEEKVTDWGKEMAIAHAFAEDLDLYRAISTYKRAEILLPAGHLNRKLETQYDILLCYFLGKRYNEAIDAFDKTELAHVDKTFPAYHDLLLTLYECYREIDDPQKEERILEIIEKSYPDTAEKLRLSFALREGNLDQLQVFAEGFPGRPSYLDPLLDTYSLEKKSVAKAQLFNALFPGAGYLYIGQRKSALTAFLLNGLFIAAATQFFIRGHLAAGIITTGFEAGWYFGGIYGAGEEAKYYNERLYEQKAATVLNEHKLFPALMMQYSF